MTVSPDLEVDDMPRPMGPTVPRWQLGEQLQKLRQRAELTQDDAKRKLDCSISKIQKIEGGDVSINRSELGNLLEYYGVPEADWEPYLELQKLGKSRGWWSKFGALPAPFAEFLGIESAATELQIFETMVVSGLLQTEDYARAHERTVTPGQTPEQIDRQVTLRMERKAQILEQPKDDRPDSWFVFDEAVLHRAVGGAKVMAAQLRHLIDLANQGVITVQVVPFARGGYPGSLGSFSIYSFNEDLHSPVAYVECPAGNLYMEKAHDLRRCTLAFKRISAVALSPDESVEAMAGAAASMLE